MASPQYREKEEFLSHRTNGHNLDFYNKSLELDKIDDESIIPEPMSLEGIEPTRNIDSMFNLLLSDNQNDRNTFTHDYLQRKIDRRLKEIEELSTEKKKGYIQDAKVVLHHKLDNTGILSIFNTFIAPSVSKRGYYNIHFTKTPDSGNLTLKLADLI